jgi:hypothetical protein
VVIELNHALLSDLTTEGVPAVWGDVTREEILRAASLEDSPDIQILFLRLATSLIVLTVDQSLTNHLDTAFELWLNNSL